jgi:hypothetical protein
VARPEVLAESGMAALECPTATSRRSFMGITNGSRRPQAAVARPQRLQPESTQSGCRMIAAPTAGIDPEPTCSAQSPNEALKKQQGGGAWLASRVVTPPTIVLPCHL